MATVAAPAQRVMSLEEEQARLWSAFADAHADIGNAYARAQLFEDARAQLYYALSLDPDHQRARRWLGYRRVRGEWVEDSPLPEKSPLTEEEKAEARVRPDENRQRLYQRSANRALSRVEAARDAGELRTARILAHEVLYYDPDNAVARELRGHARDGAQWVPGFSAPWRDAGRKLVQTASEGDDWPGEDEQAKAIETTFVRRQSQHLAVRTSFDEERAREMHRHAEATLNRAMELLGVEDRPFGGHRFTLTHLRSVLQYHAMLEKVLKLEGTQLDFARRMAGHSQREPWGFVCRGDAPGADDMMGNTISIRVLEQFREGQGVSQPWITTGFSYLVTSQSLGTCSTTRYRLVERPITGASHQEMPEFTRKSGTPEHLRHTILNEVIHKRDLPLNELVHVDTNDMVLEYAAKAFSLMEFFFAEHEEATRKWLAGGRAPRQERVKQLEEHFGMKINELEIAWREWVLAKY
jgi:tetratricopeptide (TPR) repeat protein